MHTNNIFSLSLNCQCTYQERGLRNKMEQFPNTNQDRGEPNYTYVTITIYVKSKIWKQFWSCFISSKKLSYLSLVSPRSRKQYHRFLCLFSSFKNCLHSISFIFKHSLWCANYISLSPLIKTWIVKGASLKLSKQLGYDKKKKKKNSGRIGLSAVKYQ